MVSALIFTISFLLLDFFFVFWNESLDYWFEIFFLFYYKWLVLLIFLFAIFEQHPTNFDMLYFHSVKYMYTHIYITLPTLPLWSMDYLNDIISFSKVWGFSKYFVIDFSFSFPFLELKHFLVEKKLHLSQGFMCVLSSALVFVICHLNSNTDD